MRFATLFLLISVFSGVLSAQSPERFSRAEIRLGGRPVAELAALGLEVDHGHIRPGHSITSDFSAAELQTARDAGFDVQIVIDDVVAYYAENGRAGLRSGGTCGVVPTGVPTPANYTYGSMAGFHTYAEMLAVLDSMHARFPGLISARAIVSDTLTTYEGRPLWYVKVSDNPTADEPEPAVLYTALHHAREPNGMSQMLFFLWHVLENYATDDRVKYVVDHNELYFIPCLNPDGYIFNEATNPDGGGMWRKNRRDNADGSFGVDLNRNYGFNWGWNDQGSSPTPGASNYRGPEAFSEPESRMVRDFALEHEFLFALNYHTWGNLLIYPWSYSDQLADSSFYRMGQVMTRDNGFNAGTPIQTVGYTVNGSSDDWMYGAAGVYAFTPEVGTTGFWPSFDEIDPLNKSNVWPNLFLALSAGRYGEVRVQSDGTLPQLVNDLTFEVTRYGLEDGPLLVSIEPVSANVVSVAPAQTFNLARFQSAQGALAVELAPWVASGDTVGLAFVIDNGTFAQRDTAYFVYGIGAIAAYSSSADNLTGWTGGWQPTEESYVSAPASITDSPFAPYLQEIVLAISTAAPVAIPANALSPRLRFFARWDVEEDYDYVQVLATTPDGQTTPLCGFYTEAGDGAQPNGEPVYDGVQSAWVEENIDLSDFAGQQITLSFVLVSDNVIEGDGFYFDDLVVEFLQTTGVTAMSLEQFRLSASPNPATDLTVVRWNNAASSDGSLELVVTDALGQTVLRREIDAGAASQLKIDMRSWPPGVYTYVLRGATGQTPAGRMVKH